MVTLKGTVKYQDLEGGIWVLDAEDGTRYNLQGGDKGLYKNGQRATVTGEVDGGAMGFAMVGEILKVKSFTLG